MQLFHAITFGLEETVHQLLCENFLLTGDCVLDNTLLLSVFQFGYENIYLLLVKYGARLTPHTLREEVYKPLYAACQHGCHYVVKTILSRREELKLSAIAIDPAIRLAEEMEVVTRLRTYSQVN